MKYHSTISRAEAKPRIFAGKLLQGGVVYPARMLVNLRVAELLGAVIDAFVPLRSFARRLQSEVSTSLRYSRQVRLTPISARLVAPKLCPQRLPVRRPSA